MCLVRSLAVAVLRTEQANGFVTNRKDAATQVESDMVESQTASAADPRKAKKSMLQSAQNLSFVRLLFLLYDFKRNSFLLLKYCVCLNQVNLRHVTFRL